MYARRIYRNASGDILKVDVLHLLPILTTSITEGPRLVSPRRTLDTSTMRGTAEDSDRVVASIEMIGDFAEVEAVSGDYKWALWRTVDNDPIYMKMGDLLGIGDTA